MPAFTSSAPSLTLQARRRCCRPAPGSCLPACRGSAPSGSWCRSWRRCRAAATWSSVPWPPPLSVIVPGRFLASLDHVLHGLEFAVGLHRPHVVVGDVVDQRREAFEVFLARAARLLVEIAGEYVRHVDVADGVAVGLRLRERAPADPAAAAGAVLDRDRLAEDRLEVARQQPCRDVAAAAGGVGHDHQRGRALGTAAQDGPNPADGQRRGARTPPIKVRLLIVVMVASLDPV